MEFERLSNSNKQEVEKILNSSDVVKKREVIVGMINGIDDFEWLQEQLLNNIGDEDFWIAKNSIAGLGDLARIYGKLDLNRVKNQLKIVTNKELSGVIASFEDDVKIYLDV